MSQLVMVVSIAPVSVKTSLRIVALLLICPLQTDARAAESWEQLQSTLMTHCAKCHGQNSEVQGDVDLVSLSSSEDLLNEPELLESVVAVLSDRLMPPDEEPPLPERLRTQMIEHLRTMLVTAQQSLSFGHTPIRRMNRFQYNNAVVDLLELDRDIFRLNERLMRRRQDYFRPASRTMPKQVKVSSRPLSKDIDNQRPEGFRGVSAFPQDKRAEHGFDNRADHLSLSPLLMESFLQLSQSIVESPDLNPQECRSWDRVFARPGESARGPLNGRYEAEVSSVISVDSTTAGPAAPQNMKSFDGRWSGDTQLFWRCQQPDNDLLLSFDASRAGYGLTFGFTKAGDYGTFDVFVDDIKIADGVDLHHTSVVDSTYQVPDVQLDAGHHSLRFTCVGRNAQSTGHFFGLDYIEIAERQSDAVSDQPVQSDAEAIRQRLTHLLRRAFRRPVDPETLDRFCHFAAEQLAAGTSFEDTMRTLVGAILGMPAFLYTYETSQQVSDHAAESGNRPLDDLELASRLAWFLWSSIPDDALLDLAEAGRLHQPSVLSEQIDRMLNDHRISRFCDNFPAQWLQLDRLITSIPDPQKFGYFYYNGYRTSMHMMSEPLLLFETILIENRSIVELLDPPFRWQSQMLRANYDGSSKAPKELNVQVFNRVPADDPRHCGIMTCAAVMTMTSTPTRTQPITRGAWINAVIFNDPPDPPPADVPPLPEGDAEELAQLTIRERLAVHRERQDCAGCHDRIDPLGFALENFGPTGVWRDQYENGRDVDSAGTLFNRYDFESMVEFKQQILQNKQRFIRGFVSHLLSYAVGRELGPADSPVVDGITSQAMAGNDSLRTILKKVAMSAPFIHKNHQPAVEQSKL